MDRDQTEVEQKERHDSLDLSHSLDVLDVEKERQVLLNYFSDEEPKERDTNLSEVF